MSVPAVAHAPPTTRARVGSAVNSMLIGLMGIVFGLGIMYLLSRVMQTSRRVAVVERQLKQHQMKTDDVDVQLNYLLMKAAQPPQPPPVPPVVRRVDTVAGAASAAPKPPAIPFPGNVTLVDMSPDMLMPPGLMNLFCGFMDEMQEGDASVKAGARVEEVVEDEAPVPVVQVLAEEMKPVEKEDEKKSEMFIDGSSDSSSTGSSSSSSDNEDDKVTRGPPPRRGAGRGGGRGRGKKV